MEKLEDAVKTARAELESYHFVLEFAVTFNAVIGDKRMVRYLPACCVGGGGVPYTRDYVYFRFQ